MKQENKLSTPFSFWLTYPKKQQTAKWEDNMINICSFNTVEDFWKYYQHMTRLTQLPIDSGFQLFLENIKPMWEDSANTNGGRFILRVKKQYANYFWENLLISFIGENHNQNNLICGLTSNCKENEILISMWVKENNQIQRNQLKNWIRLSLGLQDQTEIEYRDHPKQNKLQENQFQKI